MRRLCFVLSTLVLCWPQVCDGQARAQGGGVSGLAVHWDDCVDAARRQAIGAALAREFGVQVSSVPLPGMPLLRVGCLGDGTLWLGYQGPRPELTRALGTPPDASDAVLAEDVAWMARNLVQSGDPAPASGQPQPVDGVGGAGADAGVSSVVGATGDAGEAGEVGEVGEVGEQVPGAGGPERGQQRDYRTHVALALGHIGTWGSDRVGATELAIDLRGEGQVLAWLLAGVGVRIGQVAGDLGMAPVTDVSVHLRPRWRFLGGAVEASLLLGAGATLPSELEAVDAEGITRDAMPWVGVLGHAGLGVTYWFQRRNGLLLEIGGRYRRLRGQREALHERDIAVHALGVEAVAGWAVGF